MIDEYNLKNHKKTRNWLIAGFKYSGLAKSCRLVFIRFFNEQGHNDTIDNMTHYTSNHH